MLVAVRDSSVNQVSMSTASSSSSAADAELLSSHNDLHETPLSDEDQQMVT